MRELMGSGKKSGEARSKLARLVVKWSFGPKTSALRRIVYGTPERRTCSSATPLALNTGYPEDRLAPRWLIVIRRFTPASAGGARQIFGTLHIHGEQVGISALPLRTRQVNDHVDAFQRSADRTLVREAGNCDIDGPAPRQAG